jgi:glycosyltransferase involved in cell wall biosynthesis
MRPQVSIVIPVYRNADTLAELYRQLARAVGERWSLEIVFVDDACPAGSLEVLRRLAAADGRVAVVALAANVGQNRAVLTGLGYARGKVVVVMDADLQDPPEAVPLLVDALGRGPAAVFAGRRGSYQPAARMACTHVFRWVLHHLSMRRLPRDAGLFVAMKRGVAERLARSADPRPYVVGMIGRAGVPVHSIPVERRPNPAGRSGYSGWMRLRLAAQAVAGLLAPPRAPASVPAVRVAELIGAPFHEPAPYTLAASTPAPLTTEPR